MKEITREMAIQLSADLWETGCFMNDDFQGELHGTYWTLEDIARQRRGLNQISIDLETVKMAIESGDFEEIIPLFKAIEGFRHSEPLHPSAPTEGDLEGWDQSIDSDIPF